MTETQSWSNIGRALAGRRRRRSPKDGARFHFNFPGSLQGFHVKGGSPARLHEVELSNVAGHSRTGERSWRSTSAVWRPDAWHALRAPPFFDKEVFTMPTYQLVACPTLYSGQRVECRIKSEADSGTVAVRLFSSVYDEHDELIQIYGDAQELTGGCHAVLSWEVPETHAYPIFEIGVEIETRDLLGVDGTLYLDYLTWVARLTPC